MLEHEKFEALGALAALGQVSAEELITLNEHLAECESCRRASAEFTQIVHSELPLAHKDRPLFWARVQQVFGMDRYTEKFLTNAKARGFQFSEELAQQRTSPIGLFGRAFCVEHALILGLLIVAVSATVFSVRTNRAYERVLASRVEVPQISGSAQNLDSWKIRIDQQENEIAQIQGELGAAKERLGAALERTSAAERRQELSSTEAQRLKAALAGEAGKSTELTAKLDAETRRTAVLNEQIQQLDARRTADTLQIVEQQRQVDEFSQQLKAQTEVLNSERQLLSAGRDIRDLMGARNLHIIDVFDADLKGNNKKAFGRVFYTEGKSLIFYAFDLGNERVVNAKHSFQAWGVRDGAGGQARSLGIFYADDKAQKRWVLKIEDPNLLSQIDSVFVTAEPFGGAKQPSGQKLLYAYLKNPANHP